MLDGITTGSGRASKTDERQQMGFILHSLLSNADDAQRGNGEGGAPPADDAPLPPLVGIKVEGGVKAEDAADDQPQQQQAVQHPQGQAVEVKQEGQAHHGGSVANVLAQG